MQCDSLRWLQEVNRHNKRKQTDQINLGAYNWGRREVNETGFMLVVFLKKIEY